MNKTKRQTSDKVIEKKIDNLLSWYTGQKTAKAAQRQTIRHMKKKYKANASEQFKAVPIKFGYICMMLDDKIELSKNLKEFYDENVKILLQLIKDNPVVESDKPKITIQDRLSMKADECIAELEYQVDEVMNSDFKSKPSPLEILKKFNMKPVHTRFIKKWAEIEKEEWEKASTGEDKDLTEAYGRPKSKLKKMVAYYNSVIDDCSKVKSLTNKKRGVKIKIL
tara:strand:+ start:1276 stop:1944 length:669 start_codon:yes stop_codon:yes gene_type:complete